MTYVKIKITEHSKEAIRSDKEFEGKDLSGKQVSELITAFSQSLMTHLHVSDMSDFTAPLMIQRIQSCGNECACTTEEVDTDTTPVANEEYEPPTYPLMEKTKEEIDQIDLKEAVSLFANPYEPEDPSIAKAISEDLTPEEQESLKRFMNPEAFGINLGDKMKEALANASANKKPKNNEDKPKTVAVLPLLEPTENDYHITGIKYYGTPGLPQVPHYKCRYECPNHGCGTRSTHYIREGQQHVYCYNCNEKIKVEPASEKGFPNRDTWGNYYLANISRGIKA